MFVYFDKKYSWHAHFHMALLRGGNLSEIDHYCRHLKGLQHLEGDEAAQAWFDAWYRLADHVETLARADEDAGHNRSAGHKYARASVYYFSAEKMLNPADTHKEEAYDRALATFRKGVTLGGEAIEFVTVPFAGAALPALFVPAKGMEPSRSLLHFNGWDGTKEIVYQRVSNEFRERGTALLIVDHGGTGEALRKQDLHLRPNTEAVATACLDYLMSRPEIDPNRIGVLGIAVGSYHAARAAAFEKRLRCAVSWGGYWEPAPDLVRVDKRVDLESIPTFHNMWVTGTQSAEEAAAILRQFTLESIMPKITCPLLVVAGESDRRQGLTHAQRQAAAATSSPRVDLRIFTEEEGGAEYCQNDNPSLGLDFVADWTTAVLDASSSPAGRQAA